ncbi:AAA family ATPase [Methylocystis parvus]|uniref:AAA family ATPase n=1 Tax=Methylocystis parvus TaxID=134 RepID=UPI003C761522
MNVAPQPEDAKLSSNVSAAVSFTIVHSETGVLTKTYRLNASHKPEQTAAPPLVKGTAHRIPLKGTADQMAAELANHLESCAPTWAFVLATAHPLKDVWPLVTAQEADGTKAIARTKRFFQPTRGPALFALDLDFKTYPGRIVGSLETAGSISTVLATVFPQIGEAACVRRPSASTGVVVIGDETPAKPTGAHWYFFVLDGEDAPAFARRLFDRLALAGWLWGEVSEAGIVIYRGLFDLAASSDPSRLFYEANALLASPELQQVKGARAAKVSPGGFLDTHALAPLSDEEQEKLKAIKAQIARDLEPECKKKRELWKERRFQEMVRKGKSPKAARKAVSSAVERHVLTSEFEILLDDGRTVSVGEILEDPAEYHKQTCADPMEPEYRGGRNIAIIFADKPLIRIHSQAHGGIDYRLERSADEKIASWFDDLGSPEPEPSSAAPAACRFAPVAVAGQIDPQSLPLREWIIEPRIPIGDASLIAGEPGVNKSSLVIRDALAIASGAEPVLTGGQEGFPESLHRSGPVLIYNAEDSLTEMRRRIVAAMNHYRTPDPLLHPIYLWSGVDQDMIVIMRREGTSGKAPLKRDKMADELEAAIKRLGVALVVLDPLVSLSAGASENDTDDMNALLQELTRIAARNRIGLVVIHHTAKSTRNSYGDMGASRGSFAIPAKVRAMVTLGRLDDNSAAKFGVPLEGHIRMDYAKVSHGKKPGAPVIYQIRSVPVGNSRAFCDDELHAANLTASGRAAAMRGDFAPVLEVVPVSVARQSQSEKVDLEREETARAVLRVLKTPGVYPVSSHWPELGQSLRKHGLTRSESRNTITSMLTARLGGECVVISCDGQDVRVSMRQDGSAAKAPWLIEIRAEEVK